MIYKYQFYYKENNVFSIQSFNTLKEIKAFLELNAVIPFKIKKRTKGFYETFKIWRLI